MFPIYNVARYEWRIVQGRTSINTMLGPYRYLDSGVFIALNIHRVTQAMTVQ